MQLNLTFEQESRLAQIAAQEGRGVSEVAQALFDRSLNEEERFIEAVRLGEAELDRGEFLTHEEVGARIRQLPGA